MICPKPSLAQKIYWLIYAVTRKGILSHFYAEAGRFIDLHQAVLHLNWAAGQFAPKRVRGLVIFKNRLAGK
jgi:hypothetical protein